mmetsp:Transcript_83297/g.235806  ORF Transcript_83297/g.235806 Transcript_83297/m.235806 type:complete len:222 (-) Transcript_83297:1309-1974(-)
MADPAAWDQPGAPAACGTAAASRQRLPGEGPGSGLPACGVVGPRGGWLRGGALAAALGAAGRRRKLAAREHERAGSGGAGCCLGQGLCRLEPGAAASAAAAAVAAGAAAAGRGRCAGAGHASVVWLGGVSNVGALGQRQLPSFGRLYRPSGVLRSGPPAGPSRADGRRPDQPEAQRRAPGARWRWRPAPSRCSRARGRGHMREGRGGARHCVGRAGLPERR